MRRVRSNPRQVTDRTPPVARDGSAVNRIYGLIASGRFAPGERLPPERSLALEFGLSRGSVREAIRELGALHVLETRRGAGTYVNEVTAYDLYAPLQRALTIDPGSLLHVLELRRILEPVAAALAATRLSKASLAELEEFVAGIDQELKLAEPDLLRIVILDEWFHQVLFQSCGNPLISGILQSVMATARQGRSVTVAAPASPQMTLEELRTLLAALRDRDPLRSDAAMSRHLLRVEEAARIAFAANANT